MHDGDSAAVLEARHIRRSFGAVVALADASLSLRSHEVLGLVGDNGAGKSTFLKILSGVLAPHDGELAIDGRPVQLRRADARQAADDEGWQKPLLEDGRGLGDVRFKPEAVHEQAEETLGRRLRTVGRHRRLQRGEKGRVAGVLEAGPAPGDVEQPGGVRNRLHRRDRSGVRLR